MRIEGVQNGTVIDGNHRRPWIGYDRNNARLAKNRISGLE